jgi:hypothetical protein
VAYLGTKHTCHYVETLRSGTHLRLVEEAGTTLGYGGRADIGIAAGLCRCRIFD